MWESVVTVRLAQAQLDLLPAELDLKGIVHPGERTPVFPSLIGRILKKIGVYNNLNPSLCPPGHEILDPPLLGSRLRKYNV